MIELLILLWGLGLNRYLPAGGYEPHYIAFIKIKKGSKEPWILLRRLGSNQCPPAGGYEPHYIALINKRKIRTKKRLKRALGCCEDWDRTSDLRVMSPTSYRCSTSRCKTKVLRLRCQIINCIQ